MSSEGAEVQAQTVPVVQNVPSWLDQSAVESANKLKPNGTPWGYGYLPEKDNTSQTWDVTRFHNEPEEIVPTDVDWEPFRSDIDIHRAEILDSIPLSQQLTPPLTYSFQETTFARRLHRAGTESAYRLMLDPRGRPGDFDRIFRLSLMGRDRAKLLASLKMTLERGPHEDLDFWEAPLIHIGGAGTHYPRRDPYGNLLSKKESHNLGIIGPQTLALLENASRDRLTTDMTVHIGGFEGEWFDPHDVQGYLEEKGIFIDPISSFAEAEIVEWPQTSDSESSTSSFPNPQTPPESAVTTFKSTPLSGEQLKRLDKMGADLGQWNEFTNMSLGAVGYSDAQSGSWMNFVEPGQAVKGFNADVVPVQASDWTFDTMDGTPDQFNVTSVPSSVPASPTPHKKNVIIDISKLVQGKSAICYLLEGLMLTLFSVLIVSSMCLGRTPGFRRRDVDRALAISSFDAF